MRNILLLSSFSFSSFLSILLMHRNRRKMNDNGRRDVSFLRFLFAFQLFRNILYRWFCSVVRRREAKSRMHCGSCLQLAHVIATEPSNIMLSQAFGNNFHFLIKSIEEVCKLFMYYCFYFSLALSKDYIIMDIMNCK